MLVIYRGLPASGKTTLAKVWVASDPAHRARANRDDLRRMLHDGVYLGHDTEGQIVKAQDSAIRALLEAGVSVACDDTNLSQRRARQLVELARAVGVGVEVIDLTDVPVETCIARDDLRGEGRVGAGVIRGMYDRYGLANAGWPLPLPYPEARPAVVPYAAKPGAQRAIMVDLDGTLCLHNGRSPYDESRVSEDLPNPPVVAAVRAMRDTGCRILICSGRSDGCQAATEAWLREHLGADEHDGTVYEDLFMRVEGDRRRDSVVKLEIFDHEIRDYYDVLFVLDDRQQVVDVWREIGLTVFQVAPGDF